MLKKITGLLAIMIAAGSVHAETLWVREAIGAVASVYHGASTQSAKIEIGVWPVAPGHAVGAVYTTDNWQSLRWVNTSSASESTWVRNVSNPFGGQDEVWRIVLAGPSGFGIQGRATFKYAIYVDTYSRRTWNNNNSADFTVSVTRSATPGWGAASYRPSEPMTTGLNF